MPVIWAYIHYHGFHANPPDPYYLCSLLPHIRLRREGSPKPREPRDRLRL